MVNVVEKYVRNGWPAIDRPDLKTPRGWSMELISGVNRIHHPSLSPDGERLAFLWKREGWTDVYCLRLGPAGGWPVRLTFNRKSEPYWWDAIPRWSPDGRWLAFGLDEHVHVANPDNGWVEKVTGFTAGASSPVWMPDSQGLVITIELEDSSKLMLTDREGRSARRLTYGTGDDLDARPAPDGKRILFTHAPQTDPNRRDLRLLDLASGETSLLVGDARQKDWGARWSPDGEWIAFLSQRSGFYEIWLVRPDGTQRHQLSKLGQDIGELAWSPDGRRLAFTTNQRAAWEVALIEIETGITHIIAGGKGMYSHLDWGPSGDFLTAAYENPTQPPDLYKISLPGGQRTQLTFSNPPFLAQSNLVVPEEVRYPSFDGLEIPGILYRPTESNRAAIVYPHGGPTDQYGYYWDIFAQYLVAKGYTFLAPNYRGSTGYGVDFEHANYNNWGLGDTEDVLLAADWLATRPEIEREQIGIMGASYGGYMVACCLSRDPQYRFACGVSKFGDAHLYSSWAQCERTTRAYTEMQIGHPAHNRQVYMDGSPIYQVEQVQKPVLILHGLDDRVVPPQASEEWVETLQKAGKNFEYKTYAGEPHGFQQQANEIDVYRRTERFLDWYLLPARMDTA